VDSPSIEVRPVSAALGAEIHGVDLSQPLSDSAIAEIRELLLRYIVVFFRDQDLTPDQHVAFARRFGELANYPFVEGMEGHPEIVEVVKKEDETINFGGLWHTDGSYLEEPPLGSLLYAREVPPVGGDTLFANMYLAYDALAVATRERLQGLRAINTAEKPEAAITRTHRIEERPGRGGQRSLQASHPIVRTHPETGRRALYCSDAHTIAIEGMPDIDSGPLLRSLYEVQQRPEHCYRFQWSVGSLAFWDNRASQHNALNDYQGHRRVMHRVTIAGDRPY
jgi:taurine dioxygenase